jgi:hypothetical protein
MTTSNSFPSVRLIVSEKPITAAVIWAGQEPLKPEVLGQGRRMNYLKSTQNCHC